MKKILLLLVSICLMGCASTGSFSRMNIYKDAGDKDAIAHGNGWMGDYGNIRLSGRIFFNSYEGDSNMKVSVSNRINEQGWCGVYWTHTDYSEGDNGANWGQQDYSLDLTGAKKITFYARGAVGGEIVSFKAGGIKNKDTFYRDSFEAFLNDGIPVRLTKKWKKYTIDLKYMDLSEVVGTFCFVVNAEDNKDGVIFYLDDIKVT